MKDIVAEPTFSEVCGPSASIHADSPDRGCQSSVRPSAKTTFIVLGVWGTHHLRQRTLGRDAQQGAERRAARRTRAEPPLPVAPAARAAASEPSPSPTAAEKPKLLA
jgi:hypothetical protein